jgi:hypothetical protein
MSKSLAFDLIGDVFNNSGGYMPGIYFFADTTYLSSGISLQESLTKINSSSGYIGINCYFAEESNNINHKMLFATTIADYSSNSSVYLQHWANTSFLGSTVLSKQAPKDLIKDKNILFKKGIFDLLGRATSEAQMSRNKIYILNDIKYLNVK